MKKYKSKSELIKSKEYFLGDLMDETINDERHQKLRRESLDKNYNKNQVPLNDKTYKYDNTNLIFDNGKVKEKITVNKINEDLSYKESRSVTSLNMNNYQYGSNHKENSYIDTIVESIESDISSNNSKKPISIPNTPKSEINSLHDSDHEIDTSAIIIDNDELDKLLNDKIIEIDSYASSNLSSDHNEIISLTPPGSPTHNKTEIDIIDTNNLNNKNNYTSLNSPILIETQYSNVLLYVYYSIQWFIYLNFIQLLSIYVENGFIYSLIISFVYFSLIYVFNYSEINIHNLLLPYTSFYGCIIQFIISIIIPFIIYPKLPNLFFYKLNKHTSIIISCISLLFFYMITNLLIQKKLQRKKLILSLTLLHFLSLLISNFITGFNLNPIFLIVNILIFNVLKNENYFTTYSYISLSINLIILLLFLIYKNKIKFNKF